ncbi:PrsW family intramembrane metalloprotease [Zavarzinia sp.]|uniref:PrsW family intramembrane metalloprotease n=1 Tax=Zavarzinia sp. TaxID=2027920 RepID=UPI003564D12A
MAAAVMIGAAVLPSLVLLAFFIRSDRFPEPTGAILGTFVLGILTVLPVLVIVVPLGAVLQPEVEAPLALAGLQATALAAIPEEAFKLAVLLLFCRRLSAFDEPMDGLVYGATASLGFATLENLLYVLGGGEGWAGIAAIRALTAVPGHAMCGAIMGYYVATARFLPGRAGRLHFAAFLVPAGLHGTYDFGLLASQTTGDGGWALIGIAALALEVVWALRLQRRLRREQHHLMAARGEAPPPPPRRATISYRID